MPACSEFCNEQRVGVYCARENIIESSVCGRQARANSGDEKVRANSARKVNERLLLIEAALPGIRASRWNSWMERMGNSESLMEEVGDVGTGLLNFDLQILHTKSLTDLFFKFTAMLALGLLNFGL